MSEERDLLKTVFSSTPECPSLDELLHAKETGDPALAAQVDECPRCLGEVALYEQFVNDTPEVDGKILRRINSRLPTAAETPGQRLTTWWQSLLRPAVYGPAAVALAGVLVLIGLNLQTSSRMGVRLPVETVERGLTVELVLPKGEITLNPIELRWNSVTVGKSYKVRLMEVDHHVIWETETKAVSVSLPSEVRKQILPGKRLIWSVEAFDGKGQTVAMGSQDFRQSVGKAAKGQQ